MILKKTFGEKIFDISNYIIMIFLIIVTLYPFIYVTFASFSEPDALTRHRGLLFHPLGFSTVSYQSVLKNPMVAIGYSNTAFYLTIGTAINMLLTIFGAYVLSRKTFRIRNILAFIIVFTMFFTGGLIPFYIIVVKLGMQDTRWSLILPTAINTMNLIVMRTAFQGVPDSMEESARMDGANDFTILFRIMIPLALPTVAVMILFYGVERWNAWFYAQIFLRDRKLFPLQLVLREILINNASDSMLASFAVNEQQNLAESIKHATILVATVPILAVYPFLQKYFVKGVMIGAIKE